MCKKTKQTNKKTSFSCNQKGFYRLMQFPQREFRRTQLKNVKNVLHKNNPRAFTFKTVE